MKHFLPLVLVLCWPLAALAHAPVIVDETTAMTPADPFIIDEPEHSKAIFAELTGTPHFYRIDADTAFKFYAGITQAKLDGCDIYQTFSFDVLDKDGQRIDGRDGASFEWWPWYEEFGEMWYWVGPEIGEDFKSAESYDAGTYYIRVFNADNRGRYVLAVGDDERFGFGTIIGMMVNRTMSNIRENWWDEALCPVAG